MKASKSSNTKA